MERSSAFSKEPTNRSWFVEAADDLIAGYNESFYGRDEVLACADIFKRFLGKVASGKRHIEPPLSDEQTQYYTQTFEEIVAALSTPQPIEV